MAIYHFSAKIVSRASGRSAVAAAAYRAAEELEDALTARIHDYTAKTGVVHSEILLPDGAPARLLDRSVLWNEVEATERRKDAQLARDIEIALPRELSQAEAIALVRDFVSEQFVAHGMVADLNVHWGTTAGGEDQPHAHVMLTMRRFEPGPPVSREKIADGRATDHERDPGRSAGRARGVSGDPAADAGGRWRGSDRSDSLAAAGDSEWPAEYPDEAGVHRASSRVARLIAAARLRQGLRRHAVEMMPEMRFGPKVREWNATSLLTDWRKRWAEMANERLCQLGYDARIDHRSNAEQGIALEPQHKIGPAGARREDRGEDAERAAEHRAIARGNGDRLLAEPEIALRALTQQQSTFTKRDLAQFVSRHSDDVEQFGAVMARVQASPDLVRVGEDGRGQDRFSTREMVETEARLEQDAVALGRQSEHLIGLPAQLAALQVAGGDRGSSSLGVEQRAAFSHVTGGSDLAVVVGFAGTGKSTMLGAARVAWEAAGYRVLGAALSGIAADGLEAGAGIESRTIHSRLHGWAQGREALTARDVLVVDEAGMIGSWMMDQLVSRVRAAGAKLVLVGDPEQLQAIEAGAAFRAIAERVGSVEITEVRRQQEAWQREATRELATGRTREALDRYTEAGMVQASGTLAEAKVALVAGWDLERQQRPDESRVMLASKRIDVADLNVLARQRLQAAGALGQDHVVQTERGERRFAPGDRLMFLRNERGLGVKNGTLGTVLAIEDGGGQLTVRLDRAGAAGAGGREVVVSVGDYTDFDHGYAATVHKAQGVTVDRAHVLATGLMDRHAAYVGLTRHRDGVALHYAQDEFADAGHLARVLGRERAKDTTLDYGSEDLAQRYGARRGLVPQSEIVVRPARPSRFGGLKLNATPMKPVREPAAPRVASVDRALSQAVRQFAEAVMDGRRMRQEQLPVLPHQYAALEAGTAAIVATWPDIIPGDVITAFNARPELVQPAAQDATGQGAAIAAIEEVRAKRLAKDAQEALEKRAREAVEQWTVLERQYDQAQYGYQHQVIASTKAALIAHGMELKRDMELDRLLRQDGSALGIVPGSRLDRVVRHQGWTQELAQDIGLVHIPRQSSPSPGMGM
ncbi:MAG: Ti-type conjugative transfer relaxase TraA [Janthinobacterium lividum]